MTTKHGDHSLVGAYATDALDDPERELFERHLAHCTDCTDELRGFLETAARLAAANPVNPNPALKVATLSAAARMRQLPPLSVRDDHHKPRRLATAPVRRLLLGPKGTATTSRARNLTVAAAIIVLAVTVGVFADSQQTTRHRLQATQRNDALIETILSAPDATLFSIGISTGGTAHVVMAPREHALVFSASDLPPLTRTKCYELWLMRAGRDEPGGTIPTTASGTAGMMPMSDIQPGDLLGISIEPAPGSPKPTAPMIAEFAA